VYDSDYYSIVSGIRMQNPKYMARYWYYSKEYWATANLNYCRIRSIFPLVQCQSRANTQFSLFNPKQEFMAHISLAAALRSRPLVVRIEMKADTSHVGYYDSSFCSNSLSDNYILR
jgi:hypothetical protein